MDANDIIKRLVEDHKKDHPEDDQYNNAIAHMAKIDLTNITDGDIEEVVKSFLYNWGKMYRFLAQAKNSSWQGKVKATIQSNSTVLKRFKEMNIRNESLTKHKDEIVKQYESFRQATNTAIASAKMLHLICPNFFPLWDNAIANALRWELKRLQGNSFDKSIEAFSNEDYFRFMEGIKIFISRHSDVISSLSNIYQQGELRIIDICFWQAKRRPFFSIF